MMFKRCCSKPALILWLPLVALLFSPIDVRAQNGVALEIPDDGLAQEAQRRLILAAVRRQTSQPGAPEGAPTAEAVTDMLSPLTSTLMAPAEDQDTVPDFAGTAIPVSTEVQGMGRGRDKQSTAFPVMSTDQLEHLSDPELWTIFHKGTAEIPSDLPGQRGSFSSAQLQASKCSVRQTCFDWRLSEIVCFCREIHLMQGTDNSEYFFRPGLAKWHHAHWRLQFLEQFY
jgi:hypothetical protein